MLFTTRNAQLAADAASENTTRLSQLNEAASRGVLAKIVGLKVLKADADATDTLLRACRGNAAMLLSVGGLCVKRGIQGAVDYLEESRTRRQQQPSSRAAPYSSQPADADAYGTLYSALEGTLSNLEPAASRRAAMLGVFPEDTHVPLAVVARLWDVGSLEAFESEVTALASTHLVDVDWRKRTLSLIDLHVDYLRCRGKSELAGWHAELLRSCGRSSIGASAGDETDAYWGNCRRWVSHAHEAGAGAADAARAVSLVSIHLPALAMAVNEAEAIIRLVDGCATLRSLDVGYNTFDEDIALKIVRAARRHDSLTSLSLASCKIGSPSQSITTGADEIAAYMNASTALKELSLDFNHIDNEGGVILASALATNTCLTTLTLSENSLGPAVGMRLADALRTNTALRTLRLSDMNLNGKDRGAMEGFLAMAHALKANRRLTCLNLSNNAVDAAVGKALAAALASNATLTALDVGFNELGAEAALGIAKAAHGQDQIASLGLASSSIGADGAAAIAGYVASSTSLTELDLRSNGLGAEGGKAIAEGVVASSANAVRLRKCDLRYNSLGAEGKQVVKDAASGCDGLQVQM